MSADGTLTAQEFELRDDSGHWRVLGWGASAWFAAASLTDGADLVRRMAESPETSDILPDVDIRADGVKLRIRPRAGLGALTEDDLELARAASAAATGLGLRPDPTRLDELQLTIDVRDAAGVQSFWAEVLGYEALGEEDVVDPGWREPSIWLQDLGAARPLRNRIHVDSGRPHELGRVAREAVLAAGAQEMRAGEYYATIADAEGNEVDLVPLAAADRLGEEAEVADWRVAFSAMACYPIASHAQAAELVAAVAAIADDVGFELLVDVRPDAVTIDSGKDQGEGDRFVGLAARVQQAARQLGLVADATRLRFVQLGFDAVDVTAVHAFWRDALRYVEDPRPGLTDLYDPRRLGPTIIVQPMSAEEVERREQRNRIHVDLFVPREQLPARVDAALAAGGRVVQDAHAPFWVTIADPEGNELDISTSVGREEAWATEG